MSEQTEHFDPSKAQYLVVSQETKMTVLARQKDLPEDVHARTTELIDELSQIDPNLAEVCAKIVNAIEVRNQDMDAYYLDGLVTAYYALTEQIDTDKEEVLLLDQAIVDVAQLRNDIDFMDNEDDMYVSQCAELLQKVNPHFGNIIGACAGRPEYKADVEKEYQFLLGAFIMAHIIYTHIASRKHLSAYVTRN
jgi:hypothetical protein